LGRGALKKPEAPTFAVSFGAAEAQDFDWMVTPPPLLAAMREGAVAFLLKMHAPGYRNQRYGKGLPQKSAAGSIV